MLFIQVKDVLGVVFFCFHNNSNLCHHIVIVRRIPNTSSKEDTIFIG